MARKRLEACHLPAAASVSQPAEGASTRRQLSNPLLAAEDVAGAVSDLPVEAFTADEAPSSPHQVEQRLGLGLRRVNSRRSRTSSNPDPRPIPRTSPIRPCFGINAF